MFGIFGFRNGSFHVFGAEAVKDHREWLIIFQVERTAEFLHLDGVKSSSLYVYKTGQRGHFQSINAAQEQYLGQTRLKTRDDLGRRVQSSLYWAIRREDFAALQGYSLAIRLIHCCCIEERTCYCLQRSFSGQHLRKQKTRIGALSAQMCWLSRSGIGRRSAGS